MTLLQMVVGNKLAADALFYAFMDKLAGACL